MKNWMAKIFLKLLFLGILFSQLSCSNNKDFSIGTDFIQTNASMVYTDTVSVNLSTFKIDSLNTAGQDIALVGTFNDPNIGKLTTQSYVVLGSQSYTLDENSVYDSLILVLAPTTYYYGDTSSVYNLQVYRVTEDIQLKENESYFSNKSHFSYDSTSPLGIKSFYPMPKTGKEIRIPIDNSFGLELTNKLKSSSDPFDENGFPGYFKGVLLKTDGNANSIMAYNVNDTSIALYLYYHIDGEDDTKTLTICPSNLDNQFNEIIVKNTNSTLNKLSKTPISSNELNHNSYVQGGSGIVTRVDFPTLKNLLLQNHKFKVIKAELVIQPDAEMNFDYLPSKLYLYLTNKHNDFLTQVTDGNGNVLSGSLYEDFIYRENTTYSWNITYAINVLLNETNLEYDGLLLLPADYNTNFNNVIIADQSKSNYKTHLNLYILYYE